ncbi:hypothetical protein CBS101457_006207 [Exobasidium rhododendri]|nr:hypothetical protein CBS101457_006207 [Exobasidium rhododendri]
MSGLTGRQVAAISKPAVFPPDAFRRALQQIFSFTTSLTFPNLPDWLKYILISLVVINFDSFPLIWHIRLFSNAVGSRGRARPSIHPLLPWFRSNNVITTSAGVSPRLRLDAIPIGKDIFLDKEVATYRATCSDCDYNMHLSNSSYAKNLDYNRIGFLAKRFLRAHFDGSHFALGGATYTFHAEIPLLARYDVEMSIGSWDDKWLYVLGRFLSPSTGKKKSIQRDVMKDRSKLSKSAQNLKVLLADVVNPPTENDGGTAASKRKESAKKSGGRKLYCTSISRYCFKAGRKTIPPWFAIATSGYGTFASTRTNWDKAENLRRNVQRQSLADHEAEYGKQMPKDSIVLGRSYRKAGILSAYDPSREEGAIDDDRGLGAWQDRKNWHLDEWEERRVERLAVLTALGGVVSASSLIDAQIFSV